MNLILNKIPYCFGRGKMRHSLISFLAFGIRFALPGVPSGTQQFNLVKGLFNFIIFRQMYNLIRNMCFLPFPKFSTFPKFRSVRDGTPRRISGRFSRKLMSLRLILPLPNQISFLTITPTLRFLFEVLI